MESGTTQVYTPHLKKVLKSYQAAATNSLHGPNSVMGVWGCGSVSSDKIAIAEDSSTLTENPATTLVTTTCKKLSTTITATTTATTAKSSTKKSTTGEYDAFFVPPPFPIQQPPIFTPPDQSRCEKSETILESETISCFSVGGEKRLCLPQILNTVLRDFSLQQINCVCDNLQIFCSRCNSEQLEVLKVTGVLPLSAPSCGLITKTDAERLCAALLDSSPPKALHDPNGKPPFQVKIYHECFGRCTGLYTPNMYVSSAARCIECTECRGLFTPQKFVCHAHYPKENRTCHWGFDSCNWRSYILLDPSIGDSEHMKELLKDMKSRHVYEQKYKRKPIIIEDSDSHKRLRVENYFPYPYTLDPSALVYWYPSPTWNKVTALKPITPVITKDGKPLYIPQEVLSPFLKESISSSRPSYLIHDPSVLQESERVIPLTESDRFESHYQPNVALVPPSVQKTSLRKSFQDQALVSYHSKNSSELISQQPVLKKEPDYDSSPCCFDSDDTFSDTSFSTLSGNEDTVVSVVGEEEEVNVEDELQRLSAVMKEHNTEASLHAGIMSEVKAVIAKYRKCLKTAVQGKKLMQKELEKVQVAQQEKIKKLRESKKNLQRELLKLQNHSSSGNNTPTPCQNTEKQIRQQSQFPSQKSVSPTISSKAYCKDWEDEEAQQTIGGDSLPSPLSHTRPNQLLDVKVEPVGK